MTDEVDGAGDVERRRAGGAERRRQAQGAKSDKLQELTASLDRDMGRWADEFIFGEVWGRGGLTHEERVLVAVTYLAAGGHVDQLTNYLHGALQAGVEPEKIQEALAMGVVYAGFPKTVGALACWRRVLSSAGITLSG